MQELPGDHTKTFRAGSSFSLPVVFRSLGLSSEEIFARAGVDLDTYGDPENRITAADLGNLMASAASLAKREDIGLLVTSSFQPAGLGLVGLLAADGPDVHTALSNIVRLLRYNTLAGYPVLWHGDASAMMKFELRSADFVGAQYILEGATGIIFRFLQRLCGPEWRPDAIHLTRPKPADARPFERFFRAPISFSSTENGVEFARDWLHRRVEREEQRIRAKRLDAARAPYSELVRRQVAMSLGLEPMTGASIAASLGISRRQLMRNLKAEGVTCHRLIDEVRFARARYLLSAGDAQIAEIADAIGYPDQTSFTRAFSRWAGLAPGEWRKRHHPA